MKPQAALQEAGGRRECRARAATGMVLLLLLSLAFAPSTAAQIHYLAFGDSITFGSGDQEGGGYPARLPQLLADRGVDATVQNFGLPGETTAEGLARIGEVLDFGGDVVLLMEGTNDIGARVSPETIRFNLREMARRAAARNVETVHLTVIPRLPSANFDGSNQVTGQLAGLVRELAWSRNEDLADPFEVFLFDTADPFATLYVGGDDKLHPNPAGYDRLAEAIADTLARVDRVSPVPGNLSPTNLQQNVDPLTEIRLDLYDFGEGIDLTHAELRLDGVAVPQSLTGDERRAVLSIQPSDPLSGVVFVDLLARDLASPANTVERRVGQFTVRGTRFLDGDIDRSGRVDGLDLVAFAVRFGSRRGESRFRAFADLNGDDVVDGMDLALLAANFGRSTG